MELVHEITIDLLRPKKQIIKVTQEDSTRRILLTTLANGAPYDVTSDLESGETLLTMVEYRRADGTSGIYDTTSDGRTAVESGGVGRWLVNLDGTCFTVPGWAQINVRFMTEGGKVLHTFAISVRVQDTACPDESGGDPTQIESIADMKAAISELYNASMSEEAKNALLNLLAHVAYTDNHGQDYLDDLETELFRTADLVSISAVFEQGSAVIYDTDDLDTLRQYLTVTATYEDLSTREITGYTLSGTLNDAVSTITVSYGGKTTTFTVNVEITILFDWDYTEGIENKINSVSTVSPTMQSDGLLLQGSSEAFSACAIAPNIEALTESYKATISYSGLSSDGSDSLVAFWHYNSSAKRVRIGQQRVGTATSAKKTFATNADASNTVLLWNLADSGTLEIEYDSVLNTISYKQGTNQYSETLTTPSSATFEPRIASAQKGTTVPASVKIQHIRITKVV